MRAFAFIIFFVVSLAMPGGRIIYFLIVVVSTTGFIHREFIPDSICHVIRYCKRFQQNDVSENQQEIICGCMR